MQACVGPPRFGFSESHAPFTDPGGVTGVFFKDGDVSSEPLASGLSLKSCHGVRDEVPGVGTPQLLEVELTMKKQASRVT